MNQKQTVAREMMPWLFVGRGSAWRPFAKIRCEGGKCVWTERSRGRVPKRVPACAA